MLIAYTKTLSEVYIIGLPLAIIGFIGALFVKNSKMQTKAEEAAAIQEAKEKAALAAKAEGKTNGEAEKEAEEAGSAMLARGEQQAVQGVSMANAESDAAVEGGVDAQAVLAQHEGKSPV